MSRSSKTPTSIYLAQQGYKVSNIPLDPSTKPPKEVYEVDRTRLFGLMTTADVLVGIRQRRLGNAAVAASQYADPEYVYEDLERARALMRKLGPSSFTPKIAPLRKPLKRFCGTTNGLTARC